MLLGGMIFNLKNFTNINKHNYKAYGIQSHREFRKFKSRLINDLKNNSLMLNKYYKPVKSAIYNELNISIQGGKSNRYWNYNK
jgi:hypothetical protein